jgi:hypothetical protein
MRTLLLAGGTVGGRGSGKATGMAWRGRWAAWALTFLEVSLVVALLLTGD